MTRDEIEQIAGAMTVARYGPDAGASETDMIEAQVLVAGIEAFFSINLEQFTKTMEQRHAGARAEGRVQRDNGADRAQMYGGDLGVLRQPGNAERSAQPSEAQVLGSGQQGQQHGNAGNNAAPAGQQRDGGDGGDGKTSNRIKIINQLKTRIDLRLNNLLSHMKPDYDDSITGFNEAWDEVRKLFAEELGRE